MMLSKTRMLLIAVACGVLFPASSATAGGERVPDRDKCPMPSIPDDASFVFLGMTKSRALSTAALERSNKVARVTEVFVEPGGSPIFLAAVSKVPMILKISGATDRLAGVMNVGYQPMGFVNLGTVSFSRFDDAACRLIGWNARRPMGGLSAKGWKPEEQINYIEILADRSFDEVIVDYWFDLVEVPGGTSRELWTTAGKPPPEVGKIDEGIWEWTIENYPAGFVRIEPEEVISPVDVMWFRPQH